MNLGKSLAAAGTLLLCLVGNVHAGPIADVSRSARSGPWSEPTTWEAGRVPGAGDRVLVRAGHQVAYDVQSDHAIRVLKIAGSLQFATDRDTRLNVGLIRIEQGDEVSEEG